MKTQFTIKRETRTNQGDSFWYLDISENTREAIDYALKMPYITFELDLPEPKKTITKEQLNKALLVNANIEFIWGRL